MTLEKIITAYESGKLSTIEVKEKIGELRKKSEKPAFFTECQRVNPVKQGKPVFWIHGAFGDASVYIPLAEKIKRPFYGIQARGLFDDKTPLSGVKAIASFYKGMIRSIQPKGPYDIGGYSIGGVFAYEVARQIQTDKQIVQTLTLVDSLYPPCHKIFEFSLYDSLYFSSAGLINLTFRHNPKMAIGIINRLERPERDENDEQALVESFVRFCIKAGVNKPEEWIRNYIKKMDQIQNGYNINDYVPSSLIHNIPHVKYFNNRDGLFFGQDAAHMNLQDKDPLQGVDYWSEWKKLLPNIEYQELVVDNHLMLFEDKVALQAICDYCDKIYNRETIRTSDLTTSGPIASLPKSSDQKELEEKATHYFKKLFSAILKRPADQIQAGEPMEKYGIDSLMATQLTNQLQEIFGSLSITLFFEYRTIQELTGYFLESYGEELREILGMDKKNEDNETIITRVDQDQFPSIEGESFTSPASTALDIAIIGLSGRYPQAGNIDEYWENLQGGRDCITEIPKDRWDWREYYTKDRSQLGNHYSKWGGFIEDVDRFDPLFFNISPREAEFMDPQDRLFLEYAWMALEDAGYCREDLQEKEGKYLSSQVGVYAGVMFGEYQFLGVEASLLGNRMVTGGSYSAIANRVSYILNLHGPSMTVDTACSSSLTSIHLACQDLKHRKTDLAIAGGVNLSIHPNKYLELSMSQFISTQGHCESFGEGGEGYIPGEGVGVVLLKRLQDAEKDGDHIYGVIKGSAINHGGKTNSYTVPNPCPKSHSPANGYYASAG